MPRNAELVLSTEQREVRSKSIQSIRIKLLWVCEAWVFATFAIKVHTVNLQPQAKRQFNARVASDAACVFDVRCHEIRWRRGARVATTRALSGSSN